nr:hypothetical protein [Parabacteroides merdae]
QARVRRVLLRTMPTYDSIGHYQIGSIAVRILSFKPVTIDAAFWEERIRIAYTLRQTLKLAGVENNNTYRLVHGEGDNLPGLVIDMYAHTAVMQAHSVGMHYARHQIAEALKIKIGVDDRKACQV